MKRAFHIVYTLLALNFLIPAAIYAVAPDRAVAAFTGIGDLFGVAYPWDETGVFWRVLAIANVATLGFACVLLQLDVVRYWAAIYPLVFLKSAAVVGFAVAFAARPYPGFLAASLFDGLTVAAMIVFARGARREVLAARGGGS